MNFKRLNLLYILSTAGLNGNTWNDCFLFDFSFENYHLEGLGVVPELAYTGGSQHKAGEGVQEVGDSIILSVQSSFSCNYACTAEVNDETTETCHNKTPREREEYY